MNYIGRKNKLSSWIKEEIKEVVGEDLSNKVFCDLFAGTGIIGRIFKKEVKKVISNDIEYYSYILNKNYICNNTKLNIKKYINILNNLELKKGFIYQNYCPKQSQRMYFSDENGQIIDSVRMQIQQWKNNNEISFQMYYFLIASLLESSDEVANTASVYGSFLKKLKKTAQQKLIIKPAIFDITNNFNEVFLEDSNKLILKINGDILYLDPPYNKRQYGSNYHILNTIAKYDEFIPKGKTGVREYEKSKYCSKIHVKKEFEELIKNANFKYIFLSYNNEGLMSETNIKEIMSKYGKYSFKTKLYKRFKANKTNDVLKTHEHLHILEK